MGLPAFTKSLVLRLAGLCLLALLCVRPAYTQGDDTRSPTDIINPNMGVSSSALVLSASGSSVFVGVREASGIPLVQPAMVKLVCPLAGLELSRPAKDSGPIAQFVHIPAGECNVEVSAAGYKPAREHTEVLQSVTNRIQYVYVYLHPESESAAAAARPLVVPLGLIKEMDKAMEAMQKKHDEDARKHLDKAAKISPTNPDVAYLQGMLELDHHNLPVAEQFFQRAVSSSRSPERALLGLGYVQVQLNQPAAAVQTLEKALQLNGASERAHLMLANAYLQLREYPKAKEHARRAAAFKSENTASARILLAQILAAEGNREGAKLQLEGLLREYPRAPSASVARDSLASLAKTTPENATETGDRKSVV